MGGPALRCAAGKSNRARCFQRVALSTAPFLFETGFACKMCVQRAREATWLPSGSNFSFASGERFCYARVRPPSQPRRSLEWRLGEEIGPSYAVGSSVSRGSNGAIACYLCAALPPFMPRPPAGHAAAGEHRGGGVRARRARRRRRAAAGRSAEAGRAAGHATADEHRGGGVRARRARRRRRAAAGGSAAVVDPRRRRAGVGVGRLAGAASPSESMGGPPDMGVYDYT